MLLFLGLWGTSNNAKRKEKMKNVGILFSEYSLRILSGFEHQQCQIGHSVLQSFRHIPLFYGDINTFLCNLLSRAVLVWASPIMFISLWLLHMWLVRRFWDNASSLLTFYWYCNVCLYALSFVFNLVLTADLYTWFCINSLLKISLHWLNKKRNKKFSHVLLSGVKVTYFTMT